MSQAGSALEGGEVLSVLTAISCCHPSLISSTLDWVIGMRGVLPWCLLSAKMCVIGALRRQEPPGQCSSLFSSWQIPEATVHKAGSVYPSLNLPLAWV